MTQDPRLRTDSSRATPTSPQLQTFEAESSRNAIQQGVRDISRTLAAHGAGSASIELAFDLVLHEIIVEAREATRATGAAIVWMRDGELVCRATTGENAPELGARVDSRSELAAACISTAQIQTCRHVNGDSRFDADRYGPLGVRAMLFAPMSDATEIFGVLQLFSSSTDAFGEAEIRAVPHFIRRCIEAEREARNSRDEAASEPIKSEATGNNEFDVRRENIHSAFQTSSFPNRIKEFSNSMLLVAVLTVAIVLGLLIGWRKGSEQAPASSATVVPTAPIAIGKDLPKAGPPSGSSPSTTSPVNTTVGAQPAGPSGGASTMPMGGLVILESGKVVYRALEPKTNSSGTRLAYMVDPEYPAAAISQNIEGSVVLDVSVAGTGGVEKVAAISGHSLLREAAMAAVKQWRFAPAAGSEGPGYQTRVTIRFVLPKK